jgi:hypothetical protein
MLSDNILELVGNIAIVLPGRAECYFSTSLLWFFRRCIRIVDSCLCHSERSEAFASKK